MKILMDNSEIERSIKRISYEILEKNKGSKDIILMGIKNGGVAIGEKIREFTSSIEGHNTAFYALDITNYRDDIKNKEAGHDNSNMPDINDKVVILIDDVIFTGRSVRASLDAVFDKGRPKKIQLAALIDRGHKQIPIKADFVGKNIPTSKEESVNVVIGGDNSYVEIR